MAPDDNPSDHLDDIVRATVYEARSPIKKVFRPWHRPRKQYVRVHQWRRVIEELLDDLAAPTVVRYLGLPGTDLLDLRYFHDHVCRPRRLQLRFLGFNNAAHPDSPEQVELNISLDEVRKLPNVDPMSDVIGDDIESVGDLDSLAWKRAAELGPFDVINLDLCDGLGAGPPSLSEDTHFNALMQLLALQARTKDGWLLLLTTRAGSGHVHTDVLERLLKKYLKNLEDCPSFASTSREAFNIDDESSLRARLSSSAGVMEIFVIGLCKWLLNLAVRQNPPTVAKVLNVSGYQVYPAADHPDLISIAFRFQPTFGIGDDPLGLAQHPASVPDECDLATKMFEECRQRVDVDSLLLENVSICEQMIDESSVLLELARYEPDEYRAWLEEKSYKS
jgi:hypothetical protein